MFEIFEILLHILQLLQDYFNAVGIATVLLIMRLAQDTRKGFELFGLLIFHLSFGGLE